MCNTSCFSIAAVSPVASLEWPRGFQEFRFSQISWQRHRMVVRSTATVVTRKRPIVHVQYIVCLILNWLCLFLAVDQLFISTQFVKVWCIKNEKLYKSDTPAFSAGVMFICWSQSLYRNVNSPAVCDVGIRSFLYSIYSWWSGKPCELPRRNASAHSLCSFRYDVHKYEIRASHNDADEGMFLAKWRRVGWHIVRTYRRSLLCYILGLEWRWRQQPPLKCLYIYIYAHTHTHTHQFTSCYILEDGNIL